jgi:hypothetical protein
MSPPPTSFRLHLVPELAPRISQLRSDAESHLIWRREVPLTPPWISASNCTGSSSWNWSDRVTSSVQRARQPCGGFHALHVSAWRFSCPNSSSWLPRFSLGGGGREWSRVPTIGSSRPCWLGCLSEERLDMASSPCKALRRCPAANRLVAALSLWLPDMSKLFFCPCCPPPSALCPPPSLLSTLDIVS